MVGFAAMKPAHQAQVDELRSRNGQGTRHTCKCLPFVGDDRVAQDHKGHSATQHPSWKGTAMGIAHKGVAAMATDFGSHPHDIIAATGPCIDSCCYEVDRPVCEAFAGEREVWQQSTTETSPGKWDLDLASASRLQLINSGLSPEKIEISRQCVSCAQELFFSYRRDKGETGRHLGFIMIR